MRVVGGRGLCLAAARAHPRNRVSRLGGRHRPWPSPPFLGWFADRPVLMKIGTSVVVLAAVAVSVGATAVVKIGAVSDNADSIYSQNLQAIAALGQVQHTLSETKIDIAQFVLNAGAIERSVSETAIALADLWHTAVFADISEIATT